jgi:hypothetical protein
MNKNLIIEELNRVRLLMNYDTKKTLSENKDKYFFGDILNEGTGNEMIELLFKDIAKTEGSAGLRSAIESAIKDFGGINIKSDRNIFTLSKDVDEIVKAMETGAIASATEAGKLAKSLFKNGGSIEVKTAGADAIVGMTSFTKKYVGMTKEEMIEALSAKYSKSEAETLYNRFQRKNKIPEPVKPEPVKPEPAKVEPVDPVTWKTKLKKYLKYGLISGGLLLLWQWLTSDSSPYPDCIKDKLTEEDAKKVGDMGQEGLIIITKTNNPEIDADGGGIFYENGTFQSAGGKIKGKWSGEDEILVTSADGKTYNISCGKGDEDVVTTTTTISGGKWRKCSGTYSRGCYETEQDGPIHQVQTCIGTTSDGKFGPKTEAALKQKTGKTSFTDADIEKICGGAQEDEKGDDWKNIEPETGDDSAEG